MTTIPHRCFVTLALLLTPFATTLGQQTPVNVPPRPDTVHFSYSTLLGTGVYQLDDRTVTIFRVPLSWTFREATPDKGGIRLLMPTAIGFHDYDLLDNLIPTDDQLSTLSIVPGLELSFLAGDNWRIATSGYLGFGTDLSSTESSIIYGGGVSALRPLRVAVPETTFGAALLLSGYDPGSEKGDFIMRWSAGFDAMFPTRWRFGDRNVLVGGHVIGYYYMNQVEFQTIVDRPIKLRAELEFGVFIGARPIPKIFGISVNRLGVGYRFSDVSDAVVLFAGFPF